jgi:hypothetical protein
MEGSMQLLSERDHAEVMMLYSASLDDIEKAKKWGWTVAYTTIAAQGAILALFSSYFSNSTSAVLKAVFIALIFGLTVVGAFRIRDAQASLIASRRRLAAVKENFGTPFKKCFDDSTPRTLWPLEPIVWVVAVFTSGLISIVCSS